MRSSSAILCCCICVLGWRIILRPLMPTEKSFRAVWTCREAINNAWNDKFCQISSENVTALFNLMQAVSMHSRYVNLCWCIDSSRRLHSYLAIHHYPSVISFYFIFRCIVYILSKVFQYLYNCSMTQVAPWFAMTTRTSSGSWQLLCPPDMVAHEPVSLESTPESASLWTGLRTP